MKGRVEPSFFLNKKRRFISADSKKLIERLSYSETPGWNRCQRSVHGFGESIFVLCFVLFFIFVLA